MSGMLSLADMTSPQRVALAREITWTARRDPFLRARLADELEQVGFEDLTARQLIEMAKTYGVPADMIDEITATCSADLSPLPARHFCRECADDRLVGNDVDGWLPCPVCNIAAADVVFDPRSC